MKENNNKGSEIRRIYDCAIKALSSMSSDIVASFIRDLPVLDSLEEKSLEAKILPITDILKSITQKTTFTSELTSEIIRTANQQCWRQPYDIDDFGQEFYHNTAWFPIADIEGPLVYIKGLVEIMLLNANTKYPNHKHSPEELYLVLNGRVWWESEQNSSFCWKKTGEIIHHPSNCSHSIQSGDEPVLILALWRGGGFEKPVIG